MDTSETLEGVNGLPVFEVPAWAEVIPTSRARELLAEEGI